MKILPIFYVAIVPFDKIVLKKTRHTVLIAHPTSKGRHRQVLDMLDSMPGMMAYIYPIEGGKSAKTVIFRDILTGKYIAITRSDRLTAHEMREDGSAKTVLMQDRWKKLIVRDRD